MTLWAQCCRRASRARDTPARRELLQHRHIHRQRRSLDDAGLRPCEYDDLDAVRLTRGFMEAPDRYLRAALEVDD
jgi:hypothetical protein